MDPAPTPCPGGIGSAAKFQELSDGVFRRHFESLRLNVCVVIVEEGVIVIDTMASHVEADELRDELRTVTQLPVRWVIDTHWHWDHTFGNARFPGAEIRGHDMCRKNLVGRGESLKHDAIALFPDRAKEFEAVETTPPTRVVTDTAMIDFGEKVVTMSYHGLGHTDADLVVTGPARRDRGRSRSGPSLCREGIPVPEAARLGPYPSQVMTSALNRALSVSL
jgi:glyoxylase-like metal-dependent hydrolase (beta-lactamase superfamily II)